jgi:uncharacterized protein YbaP (TraB family)
MRRIFPLLLLLALTCLCHAQLLYKISGGGLTEPSYIFGTHHLASPSIRNNVKGLQAALASTRQLYGEVVMSEIKSTANIMLVQQSTFLPGNKHLTDYLTPTQAVEVDTLLHRLINTTLEDTPQFNQMTPSTISTFLQTVIDARIVKGFNPQEQLDALFQNDAIAKNIPVKGLETVEFQFKLLFKSRTPERDAQLLVCMAENLDKEIDQSRRLYDAYSRQDLKTLYAVIEEKMNNSCDNTSEEDNSLIYDRNANWVKAMPAIIKEAPTFFVVGAGHLPSDRGVLELLRKAGYTVEGVR